MIGTKLAHYGIVSHLGSGGMGDVYQAIDSKLGRNVAIKLLPQTLAYDPERVARFEREARVLAALNHPNIAAIHGFEQSPGQNFLVMEFVEGETLADRITRGPIPLEDALRIATEITLGLEAAHEKGIIHRDLKPANIKITRDDIVKILDFGLAKVCGAEGVSDPSNSPTMVSAPTPGVILGTASYISPEQVKGKEADRTSDVWAFGCVLYEMLTGHRVFCGESVGEILAEVMKAEPQWNLMPAATPEGIRRLLRRCLQKDRKQRLQHIGDARIEIGEARLSPQEGQVAPTGGRRAERLAWISALAVAVLIAAVSVTRGFRPVPPSPLEMRLEITTPPTSDAESLAISPDGQKIVFAGLFEGRSQLWLRLLDSVSARPLAGTDYGFHPFWSPDSQSVGFFADGKLKRIDIDTGSVRQLANASVGRGGAWSKDRTILFAPFAGSPLLRVSDEGVGEAVALTHLEMPQQASHRFPQFLPDGRHFLYYVTGSPEAKGIYVGSLDGSETRRLVPAADSPGVYTSTGHLLFVSQGTLLGQSFDPVRLTLAGNVLPIAGNLSVLASSPSSVAPLSASASGPIVFRTGLSNTRRQFEWVDRKGGALEKIGEPDSANPLQLALSPNGKLLAFQRSLDRNSDIWQLDVAQGVPSRLTTDTATDNYPVWSFDSSQIVFSSSRKGVYALFRMLAGRPGSGELLLPTSENMQPTDWSSNGQFLLYKTPDSKQGYDLWALELSGGRKFSVAATEFDEREGQFSPDRKWIAYQSNRSTLSEIYVQPFPAQGSAMQVSKSGGAQVRWRGDGKELFYIGLDNWLMAIPIQIDSDGKTIAPGKPVPLFPTHIGGALQSSAGYYYAVASDGERFLMNTVIDATTPSPITIILNWHAEQRK